ncbi:unnamed protein product, partial [Cyprideis torosa]
MFEEFPLPVPPRDTAARPQLAQSSVGTQRLWVQLPADPLSGGGQTFNLISAVSMTSELVTVGLREEMSVDDFLVAACAKANLFPFEHFVRVKKRKGMDDAQAFVPHREDYIENYFFGQLLRVLVNRSGLAELKSLAAPSLKENLAGSPSIFSTTETTHDHLLLENLPQRATSVSS